MLQSHTCAHGRHRTHRVFATVVLGGQLALGATCSGAERTLSPAEARAVAERYIAGVVQLRELLDGVQAEGRYSYEMENQSDRERRVERRSKLKYFVCDKKIKRIHTASSGGQSDAETGGVFIYNGITSYTALLNQSGKYSLMQRGPRDAREEQKQKIDVYRYVHCPLSMSIFYIPYLVSSADYEFQMTDVDEITAFGASPAYRIHFDLVFLPSKAKYKGWLISEPRRQWALTKYELTNESPGFRKTLSGSVSYDSSVDQPLHPSTVSSLDVTIFTIPKNAKKRAGETHSIIGRDTMVFDRYEFRKTPDSEFSLASIGLGSAELPPGVKSNRLSYFLVLCSVVSLVGALAIAYYLRRTSEERRSVGGAT